jgi:hypothetical protein
MGLINESLKHCIESIREIKYSSLKRITQELITYLGNLEGVDSYEDLKKDQIVFSLPATSLKTKVIYPKESYSLSELVKLAKTEANNDLMASYNLLMLQISKNQYKFNLTRLLA